eukprot:m.10430 g.10430  ORF g.10430 m.10430 type:complete len:266 (+) comp5562_c0_seq1:5004-5801(+)
MEDGSCPYKVLGVPTTATLAQISKAYKKAALKYHPDKNPGDKKAEDMFRKAVEAQTLLLDEEAKAAYDKVLKAKEAVRLRDEARAATQRQAKSDLEARERAAAARGGQTSRSAQQEYEQKVKQLRTAMRKRIEEEQTRLHQEFEAARAKVRVTHNLLVKWLDEQFDLDEAALSSIFSKYGPVTVVMEKPGTALVAFEKESHAETAELHERGNAHLRQIKHLGKETTRVKPKARLAVDASAPDLERYEADVLARMRQHGLLERHSK